MPLTYDEAKKAQDNFEKKYFFSPPWNAYMNGCGIQKIANNYCIVAYLRQPLPPGLLLPQKHLGFRVITEVTGEIVAQ